MSYESKDKRCPLMGGQPCMGRDCACAKVTTTMNKTKKFWACGFMDERMGLACAIAIESVDEEGK